MSQLQAIQSGLSYLEHAAADLMRYHPRQWADIQMCRWCAAYLLKWLRQGRS